MNSRPSPARFWGLCGAAALVFLYAARHVLPPLVYQINPDAVAYISIARKYLAGQFGDGINAYWNPMISWLMTPMLALDNEEPLRAAKLVCIASGCVTIVGAALLARAMRLRTIAMVAVLICIVPVTLVAAFSKITPDLLLAGLLVNYLAIVIHPRYPRHWRQGLWCGVLGAAAFLTKSYALPFFVCHQTITSTLYFFATRDGTRRRAVIQTYATSMVIFALLSGVWIGLLSAKYERLTISSAVSFARALRHPKREKVHPHNPGLVVPPNPTAVDYAEDRTNYRYKSWSPFASTDNLRHQMMLMARNSTRIGRFLGEFSLLSPVIITACLILCIRPVRRGLRHRWPAVSILTMAVYCGGYMLILVQARYLWPMWIMLIVICGAMLSRGFASRLMRRPAVRIAALLTMVLFFVTPALTMWRAVQRHGNAGWKIYDLSNKIDKLVPIHGRLASSGHRTDSLFVAFHLGYQYLGAVPDNAPAKQIRDQLIEMDARYFLWWDPTPTTPAYLDGAADVTGDAFSFLKVYALPTANDSANGPTD